MLYKNERDYENLQKAIFPGVGKYGIPALKPVQLQADSWIGFNYAKNCSCPQKRGIHFFIDDYQFLRIWKDPDSYLSLLKRFQAVCTPDFSVYTDFPLAVQIFNHYRKHWLGAYWQAQGVCVIPTISWSDESSFDWCFDGEPVGSVVAVSSAGTWLNKNAARLFALGYAEMMRRLKPSAVLIYGKIPDCCTGKIIPLQPFFQKWREKSCGNPEGGMI